MRLSLPTSLSRQQWLGLFVIDALLKTTVFYLAMISITLGLIVMSGIEAFLEIAAASTALSMMYLLGLVSSDHVLRLIRPLNRARYRFVTLAMTLIAGNAFYVMCADLFRFGPYPINDVVAYANCLFFTNLISPVLLGVFVAVIRLLGWIVRQLAFVRLRLRTA